MKLPHQGTLTIRTPISVVMYGRRAKKILSYLIAAAITCSIPAHSENLDEIQENYEQALGICATDGLSTGVGVSMMGWGLAIIVGITILAIVIHQSAAGTAHNDGSSSSGSGSGIGSVI